jgi:hypothetical protein
VLDDLAHNAPENAADEASKFGFQLGGKWFDALTISDLYMQGEINSVEPYTYGHAKVSQNYGHARQSLAHPMGANFTEIVGVLSYQYRDFEIELQANYANYQTDTALNMSGKDLFVTQNLSPLNTNKQTIDTKFAYVHAQFSYLLNPRTDMRIYAGVALRKETSDIVDNQDVFVFFGLRTFLSNRLFDF